MLLDFFKIDICLTCKLAILRHLFRKKVIVFVLIVFAIVYLLPFADRSSGGRTRKPTYTKHKLCVIVPFRNRFSQLIELVPHLNQFLIKQNVNHQLLIINQVDAYRFNRASLLNVGYKIADQLDCDYIALHDVDLLPISDDIKYYFPKPGNLMHLTAPGLHPKYNYPTFLGGILLITKHDFEKVNGMSNKYFGWGLEDDEFYQRIKRNDIKIKRPEIENDKNSKKNAFIHLHDSSVRRDTAKLYNQKEVTRRVDHETGLHNVRYSIEKFRKLSVDGSEALVYNVKLECDLKLTPWCSHKKPVQ